MMFGFGWLMMLLWIVVPLVFIGIIAAVVIGFWYSRSESTSNPPAVSALPRRDIYTSSPGPSPSRYCSHCGAGLQADWTHCPQCGAPVQ